MTSKTKTYTSTRTTITNHRYLLFQIAAIIHTVSSSSLLNPNISQLINRRCNNKLAIWVYEGSLTDPNTGRIVADVEGVELVGCVFPLMESDRIDEDTMQLLEKLCVGKALLSPENNNPSWDAANTILSRKLFCYKRHSHSGDGENNDGKSELLTSIRLRPDGPLRRLSPLESTSIYDSAITFIKRKNDLVVFSERGGDGMKSYVMGAIQPSEGTESYTIHAQKRKEDDVKLPAILQKSSEETTISPRRSRLVQFGKTEDISSRKYDSVRETYTYSFRNVQDSVQTEREGDKHKFQWWRPLFQNNKRRSEEEKPQQCTVRYTRYGEAPPWYAPGRMCTLELVGRRIDLPQSDYISDETNSLTSSLSKSLPSLVKWSIERCNPSFWSGWPEALRNKYDSTSCHEAVELFCKEGPRGITYDLQNEKSDLQLRIDGVLNKLQAGAERMKHSLICDGYD